MKKNYISIGLITLLAVTWFACSKPEKDYYQKQSFSRKGMVVSAHHLATKVGLEILREGGTAADAAIATHFALAVVYPRAGNLGGGGFMTWRSVDGEVLTLDFREKAPALAHRDMYLDSSGQKIPDLSVQGALAVGVPGSVAGMWEIYQKLPVNLPFERLVQPAIQLAEQGYAVGEMEAGRLNRYKEAFQKVNPYSFPFVKSTPWNKGDSIVQTKLANTLRLIAEQGADGFYTGTNATHFIQTMEKAGGIISAEDLKSYKPVWRTPLKTNYRQYTLINPPLPSSGGITGGQILKMIEPFSPDSNTWLSPYNAHLLVEASKRAFADRALFQGDPSFVKTTSEQLMNAAYLENKMKDYSPDSASIVDGMMNELVRVTREHFETTHYSIVDSEGNAISITTTINGNFGSKLFVEEGGYFLNNEMDDFSVAPGIPNQFGLVGNEANAIQPGKRMLSSMTPTIVEKEGDLYLVLGSPGGPTIISSVIITFLQMADFGHSLQDAVSGGRIHHQWVPDEIWFEEGFIDTELLNNLEKKGHKFKAVKRMGSVSAIHRYANGMLDGVADPRDESHAEGL